MRKAGILMHVTSLPSKYGIGTFGKEAYRFIDFLVDTNQTYWQILPLGPTSYGDSPYQTFSAFAINPYFIDLDMLVEEGLLHHDEIIDSTVVANKVDYERVYFDRFKVLRKAYERFNKNQYEYDLFINQNHHWVLDYALFMAIKQTQNGVSWIEWPNELRLRDYHTIENLKVTLKDDIDFQLFMQFKAYQQWFKVKKYANDRGIEIIGDMPIYVAFDSSDVWTKPEFFQLDENRRPILVAGVPPDNFSADGQLWGNPLYRWDVLENHRFGWFVERVRSNTSMFDILRIDHFIGFVNYYGIPFGDVNAKRGNWYKGPGQKLFDAIKEQLGDRRIIAEDLGAITDEVRTLIKYTGFPGMKLLQFAFDSREESDYIPHLYERNVIAYTGTHDNETTKQWFENLKESDLKYCLEYINHTGGSMVDSLVKATLQSVADTAIIPIQDYLELGAEGRFNVPSTLGNNWVWRLGSFDLTPLVKEKIKRFTHIYGRNR
ncbi:MAG TPA: 4-alpha-glucanotransferase [Acholeplasma sp.]|jgi:4-alpha-glucanotransferase